MKRRDFLKLSGFSTLAGISLPVLANANSITAPNLVIIHTDEHNFRTLGCYRKLMSEEQGYVWGKGVAVETPNIDWIADKGAICTSYYATTPVCSPSRSSFVSGKYPQNTPVHNNDIPMKDGIVTFAEVLRRKGYATGYAGKWHLDGTGKPQWQPERNFGFADNRYMFNRGHWKKLEDTDKGPRVAALNKEGKPGYFVDGADSKSFTTDWLCSKAIDFIILNAGKPFCYMVSIPDPHGPNLVRKPYDTMYRHLDFKLPKTALKDDSGLPGWAKKEIKNIKMNKNLLASYFGMVKCIDDNVGRILDTLRSKKLMDNTIIIFTSDHGDMCFEHGRHNKSIPLEASAKIPFVIYYPARIKPGTVIHEAISCVDFMPTILPLMNAKLNGEEEGRDCSELFLNGKAPSDWNDIVFIRGTGNTENNWVAAITKRYKLVIQPDEKPWLYDLEKDPDELKNFYNMPGYSDVVKKLSAQLLDYGKKYNDSRVLHPSNLAILNFSPNT